MDSLKQTDDAAMSRKGQTEFIVLVGIILVIAVVAFFALSTGSIFPTPVPQAIEQEKRLVEDSVTNVGRMGADIAIKWIEQQGGFFEPDAGNHVVFTNVAVSYWQRCGQTTVPTLNDITGRLEENVRDYIQTGLLERGDYFSKNVSFDFDSMYVSANILKNKVDFSVYLPTTIRGYDIPQPYTFSVPTKLGEIHEFGKAFAEDNANKRYLDVFTSTTIYFSRELETQGILTRCGQGIYQSGNQISQGLENAITYTLANTLWWQPIPSTSDKPKVYSIESLGGKTYEQLDIGLYLPDGFELGHAAPLAMTNNKYAASILIFKIPVCFAPYNWKYSVDYPVVVRVKDDLTGHYMNFAVHVDVNDMLPADTCSQYTGTDIDVELNCSAEIRIIDSGGAPLENVFASYADVYFGESGQYGRISGPITCDAGELVIGKEGYGVHNTERTPDNINGTYTLFRAPALSLHFRQVDMRSVYRTIPEPVPIDIHLYDKCQINNAINQVNLNFSSPTGDFFATNIDTEESSFDCFGNSSCLVCQEVGEDDACRECLSECGDSIKYSSSTIDYIPGGEYEVIAEMWDFATVSPTGAFITTYEIPEEDSTRYIYVPTKSMTYIADSDKETLTDDMKDKCGIDPIETEEYTGVVRMVIGCSCDELANMVSREFSSCISDDEYSELFGGGCNVNGVKNALMNECGYEVLGCG